MVAGVNTEFWINGVVLSVAIAIGIAGNLGCCLVLLSKKLCFNPTFLSLLRWLALIDSVFLCCCFFTFSLPQLSTYYRTWYYPYMMPTLLPLTSIFLNGSMYCVVSLAVEMFFSVCKPQHMNKGSFVGYILPIFAFSVFFNLPKFFELKTDFIKNGNSVPVPYVLPTKLRRKPEYSYYAIGAGFLFLGIVPLTVVSVLNCLVLNRIKKMTAINLCISRNRRNRVTGYLLSGVVIIMIICHLPRNILNIYEIYLMTISAELRFPYPWLVDISHLSLVLSSSLNILIFACQDKIFRGILFKYTLHLCKRRNSFNENNNNRADTELKEVQVRLLENSSSNQPTVVDKNFQNEILEPSALPLLLESSFSKLELGSPNQTLDTSSNLKARSQNLTAELGSPKNTSGLNKA